MRVRTLGLFLVVLVGPLALPAGAATLGATRSDLPVLSLTPSQTTVSIGATFTAALRISNPGASGVAVTVVPLPAAAWLLMAGLAVLPRTRR